MAMSDDGIGSINMTQSQLLTPYSLESIRETLHFLHSSDPRACSSDVPLSSRQGCDPVGEEVPDPTASCSGLLFPKSLRRRLGGGRVHPIFHSWEFQPGSSLLMSLWVDSVYSSSLESVRISG